MTQLGQLVSYAYPFTVSQRRNKYRITSSFEWHKYRYRKRNVMRLRTDINKINNCKECTKVTNTKPLLFIILYYDFLVYTFSMNMFFKTIYK